MFSRIIIGVDGAQGGADAMALGRRLASPQTELVAVSVAVVDPIASRGTSLEFDRVQREQAEARIAELRDQDHGLHGEAVVARAVGAGLHDAAERLGAGLIVLGSCRRGPIGRILGGDDVHQTLRGAACPVAVAPRDYALSDRAIATIGLGWNGGSDADGALDVARVLATDLQAEVHALAVVDAPDWSVSDGTATAAAITAEIAMASGRLAELEIEATTVAGEVGAELARFAAEVDLLVVGSRQRGPIGRIVLGSTSEHLTRDCPRPLMVVPRAAQPATSPA